MSNNIVFYQFSRAKVERVDFSHFLKLYGTEYLPAGRKLRDMMNSLAFAIEGFDEDPRELHAIPEVRKFYSALREAWPFFLYFANLDTESLQMMVLSCLPSTRTVKNDQRRVWVDYQPAEVVKFLQDNYGPMHTLCVRGGMFDNLIEERRKAIFAAFNLPLGTSLG